MKIATLLATSLLALGVAKAEVATTTTPAENPVTPRLSDWNCFAPEEGTYALKTAADEKLGLQWAGHLAYGYWGVNDGLYGKERDNHVGLIHVQATQRLIDSPDGGTWIRAELSGSWGFDSTTRHAEVAFAEAAGGYTANHADYFGGNNFGMPELIFMQFYNKGRLGVFLGLVNLTNHFDAVGIANCSFSSFTNTGFINSTLLPLVDSNMGGIIQYAPSDEQWFMVAAARTSSSMGYNPFRSGRGLAIVGEYGQSLTEDLTLRVNPFYTYDAAPNDAPGGEDNYGLVASIEYQAWDNVATFVRTGVAANDEMSGTFEFSCGTHINPFSSRENDYLGIAYGIYDTGAGADGKEQVVEVFYNFQINDYFGIVPHFQYVMEPAGDKQAEDTTFIGVQAVITF